MDIPVWYLVAMIVLCIPSLTLLGHALLVSRQQRLRDEARKPKRGKLYTAPEVALVMQGAAEIFGEGLPLDTWHVTLDWPSRVTVVMTFDKRVFAEEAELAALMKAASRE